MNDFSALELARQKAQQRLDLLEPAHTRNRTGQFATPLPLALEITQYIKTLRTGDDGPVHFLEPALGTGTFYLALLQTFPRTVLAEAIGVENNPQIAAVARDLWENTGLQVLEGDFTQLIPTGAYNLLLANPPYVRHHHLSIEQKTLLRRRTQAEVGYHPHGLAGLYCYFMLLSHCWLADGGLAAWLIPSEFMDVNYGETLRRYLTQQVTLLHIHRLQPDELQFDKTLVSSAIVIYQKATPPSKHQVRFSLGGSLNAPNTEQILPIETLLSEAKWTQLSFKTTRSATARHSKERCLADWFEIKRGIATGANAFFILSRQEANRRQLPDRFLRPILPSPRFLDESISLIGSDTDGFPRLPKQLVLLDCLLPLKQVQVEYPELAAYLAEGQAAGLDKHYLAARRIPWYRQEQRPHAPFLCTYMGRNLKGRGPFRFFWNQSQATAPNVYLMLYPRGELAQWLQVQPELYAEVFSGLQTIDFSMLMDQGRVYGGALYKLEPRELGRVSVSGDIWASLVEKARHAPSAATILPINTAACSEQVVYAEAESKGINPLMLETFFQPRSIAIVGASANPDKLGYTVLNNVLTGGYPGAVYPINPKAGQILGHTAYADVGALPETPDLVVIVIPYQQVPAALRECGKKGVPAVVVISAGFREAGREGMARETELIEVVKQYKMRLVGPNCLGVIDTHTPLNATFAAGSPPSGPIAFMSQSGALGTAILDWSMGSAGIGFSKFVSLGNKADVSESDLLDAWAQDEPTRVILSYSEGLPNGQKFMEVARRVSRIKPVIMTKSGVTSAGSRAVSSHTGSLAGSEQAYTAAFRQSGVLRAETMQDLFDYAIAFAYQPLLPNNRIAIVTNAGGPGILCTDALERAGLTLAPLEASTKQELQKFLPDSASAANPVDVLGDALADRYKFALEKVVADPNVDGLIVIVTPQAMTDIEGTAHALVTVAKQSAKPVLGCFMGEYRMKAAISILQQNSIPNYPFPERAARAFAAMREYKRLRDQPDARIERFEVDQAAVQAVFDKTRAEGRVSIGDAEARAILEAYKIPLPASVLAATAEEAVTAADKMGYPVVLKIASPEILHKTDVGGVKINLRSAADVRDAFDLIVYRAQRYVPDAHIWGCQVQQMVPTGTEILIGMNRDPQFGPLVTFGLGGIYVEALKDVTFRIAPFDRVDALAMLGEIRSHALIDGVRGQKPLDKAAIAETLLRISQLVTDFPQIVELDINPLMTYEQGRGALAIDMRLVLSSR